MLELSLHPLAEVHSEFAGRAGNNLGWHPVAAFAENRRKPQLSTTMVQSNSAYTVGRGLEAGYGATAAPAMLVIVMRDLCIW
jgi:hypothetical protein